MKRRPSFSFLISIAVAVVLGGIGLWFLSRLKKFPVHQWDNLRFSETLSGEKYDPFRRTPEQLAAGRKVAADLKLELLAEFPSLAIPETSVPDERNGFRKLYELSKEMEKTQVRLTRDLRALVYPSASWDPAALRLALTENSEMVARIESIAVLPERSSANMSEGYCGLPAGLEVGACANLLMAKARLAAEAKDELEALRLTTAAFNLASHLDQVETPDYNTARNALYIDLSVREAVITRLLPVLGRDADLSKWRVCLASRPDYTADTYARLVRGEWNHSMDHRMGSDLYDPIAKGLNAETEAFYRVMTSQSDFRIRNLMGQKPTVLLALPMPPLPGKPLSSETRRSVDAYWAGMRGEGKVYARGASIRAMTLAALDLLILQKSGSTLTADSIAKVTPEPITGQPFLFDPVVRTVFAPPTIRKSLDVEPLMLPW